MLDDEPHTKLRSLMNRLFVPSRLKANELYMTGLVIARLGGPDAVDGAIRSMCGADEARDDTVREDLERYWAGMNQRPH